MRYHWRAMQNLLKRIPPLCAWAIFLLILSIVFMWRALLPQPMQVLSGLDVRTLFYPWAQTAREGILVGGLPLWDAAQFSGYPFLSNPQVGVFYPPMWLVFAMPANVGLSWYVVLHLWLASFGMLLLARRLGANWLWAGLSSIAYGFNGYFAARIFAGHIGVIATDTWTPWLLLVTLWAYQRSTVWSAVIGGCVFALALLAGHVTSLVYVALIWAAFGLYIAVFPIEPDNQKITRRLLLVLRQILVIVVVGILIAGVQIAPLIELSARSVRASTDYAFASSFSMPPNHLITMFVPDYFGEPTSAGYWSVPNFEELTYYTGVLPLIGLMLALRKPGRLTWLWIGLSVFGLLLALGSYGFLHRLIYDLVPPFRVTRAPGRAAYVFVFCISLVLALAGQRWEDIRDGVTLSELMRVALPAGAALAVIGLAVTGALFTSQHPSDTSGRLWLQMNGYARFLILWSVCSALVWLYFLTEAEQANRRVALSGLIVFVIIADLWMFGAKFVQLGSAEPVAFWQEAKSIIGDTDQRVLPWGLSIFEQNGARQVGLNSVFGYNALEVASYQEFAAEGDPRSPVYDVLNVGYVVTGGPLDEFTDGEQGLELVEQTGSVWVYRRQSPLGTARIVYDVIVEPDPAPAKRLLLNESFDASETAIVLTQPGCDISGGSSGSASAAVADKRDGYWLIETQSDVDGLLVISETAYPGWQVTVDGQHAAPIIAYSTLKAVCVPEGSHTVEWRYRPASLRVGIGMSIIGLSLLIVGIIMERQREEKSIQNAAA